MSDSGLLEAIEESRFFSRDKSLVEKLEALEAKWQRLYPRLHLAQEIREADLWLENNRSRRPRQMSRFLSRWFRKAEEFRRPTLAERRQELEEKYKR